MGTVLQRPGGSARQVSVTPLGDASPCEGWGHGGAQTHLGGDSQLPTELIPIKDLDARGVQPSRASVTPSCLSGHQQK